MSLSSIAVRVLCLSIIFSIVGCNSGASEMRRFLGLSLDSEETKRQIAELSEDAEWKGNKVLLRDAGVVFTSDPQSRLITHVDLFVIEPVVDGERIASAYSGDLPPGITPSTTSSSFIQLVGVWDKVYSSGNAAVYEAPEQGITAYYLPHDLADFRYGDVYGGDDTQLTMLSLYKPAPSYDFESRFDGRSVATYIAELIPPHQDVDSIADRFLVRKSTPESSSSFQISPDKRQECRILINLYLQMAQADARLYGMSYARERFWENLKEEDARCSTYAARKGVNY